MALVFAAISVEATAVFPDVVTPLPSTTANVRLILSGVDDDHMEEAWRIAANLSPAKEGFWELEFPGAKLDMGGWLRLVTGLAQAGVKVAYAVNVLHTTMSLDQEQQLYAHIRSLLGCHLRRYYLPSLLLLL
ncbi:hypothetical protein E2C01_052227 [Portunus trituberculatus]|uniref:Uncharacterized protein n=1 Tax=Portunus trituberculatus TaxID=210409 RepID=A0A5B7GDV7_PORTR|nr:hypothetical protein [Portunus trituberculatus]